ncbi:MAG: hypothetical protein IJC59_07105 [Lachnospiraceae bacterium]|nr:hypothetical protein [Lachnospiraceae bacterium]
MEVILFFCIVLLFFLLLALKQAWETRRFKRQLRTRLQREYGLCSKREWKSGEFESVSSYYRHRSRGEEEDHIFIDDLTWQDLEMDEIYRRMAVTLCSAGDEYLYYMLRNPLRTKEELKKLEEKLSFPEKEEERRLAIQLLLTDIGRTGRYSLSEYLRYLEKKEGESNLLHYAALIALAVSLGSMFLHTGAGLLCFFAVVLFNIMTYFKKKAEIAPLLVSFRYIIRLIKAAKELETKLPEAFAKEREELKKCIERFRYFDRKTRFLTSTGSEMELLLDYVKMCFHLDLILFNRLLTGLKKNLKYVWKMMEVIGETDACIAVASYRRALPFYCLPAFGDGILQLEQGYHPLIERPVLNTIHMERNVLLTGANASGKSTFLKMTALNILLAQTIHTCHAGSYTGRLYELYTSMSVKDSIREKESYYMAEVRGLKRILTGAETSELPVFCLIDEVLKGTNTIERIAAAAQILKHMHERGITCIAATHDVELTGILERCYDHYHFEERVEDKDVTFSYQLKKGRSETRNALILLQNMGYDSGIVEEAQEMAQLFQRQGVWKQL